MFKKIIGFSLLCLALQTTAVNFTSEAVKFDKVYQDKTVLVKKIKSKITALEKKREKLKSLNNWTTAQENRYSKQISAYQNSLKKLGVALESKLDVSALIIKLQKDLKYINNARINKNAREDGLSDKYDSIYKKKAQVLIDSIIKLRGN